MMQRLLQGVIAIKESVTYQAILEEGKREGKAEVARRILLLQGRSQWGEPSSQDMAALEAITDVEQLEEPILRLRRAGSWQELLGRNGRGRGGRGRKKSP